jgi:hypothetical protein
MANIYIEDYTPKSFVVRGETREHKDSIKALGGKWNSALTDRESGDKFGAWLFWNEKRNDVQKWLEKGCKPVASSSSVSSSASSSVSSFTNQPISDQNTFSGRLDKLEQKIDYIVQLLETMNKNKQTNENKDEIIIEQYEKIRNTRYKICVDLNSYNF